MLNLKRLRHAWPALAGPAVLLATVGILLLEGRRWFCECGKVRIWIADAYCSHTSQHLADPYSFSHLQHGLLLFWLLAWCAPQWSYWLRFSIAILIESAWEVLENSPIIIDRYREATAALGYEGDSIVNSVADILWCAAGLVLARWLGFRWSLVVFVVVEVLMLITIRDSLLLNVLMLIWPIKAIATWQLAG